MWYRVGLFIPRLNYPTNSPTRRHTGHMVGRCKSIQKLTQRYFPNRPSPQDAIFVNVIVKAPIVQVFAMVFGVTHLVIELVPYVQKTSIYRSFLLKVVTLLLQAFLSCLFYQVRVQSNSIFYSLISVWSPHRPNHHHTHTGHKWSGLLTHRRNWLWRRDRQWRTNGRCQGEPRR